MNDQQSVSLTELNLLIKDKLYDAFPDTIWLRAEIFNLNLHRRGHAYLELVDKDPASDKILSKGRATIWAHKFGILQHYFESVAGRPLEAGLNVLLSISVEFHEQYGLSLNVHDIDPVYTLGDLAQKKQQILKQLEDEGILEMNKSLQLPVLLQNIAIISSETAAGYGDFKHQLEQYADRLSFRLHFFEATMQGENCSASIIGALERIYEKADSFDALIIIRGGGAKSDLACFDDYLLAAHIAQFPLPVISGIGHERDQSIVDLVSHTSLKTPTAVAQFLLDRALNQESIVDDLERKLHELTERKLQNNKQRLQQLGQNLYPLLSEFISLRNRQLLKLENKLHLKQNAQLQNEHNSLFRMEQRMNLVVNKKTQAENSRLEYAEKSMRTEIRESIINQNNKLKNYARLVELVNPQNLLKKGYTLVWQNGKLVKRAAEFNSASNFSLQFYDDLKGINGSKL